MEKLGFGTILSKILLKYFAVKYSGESIQETNRLNLGHGSIGPRDFANCNYSM